MPREDLVRIDEAATMLRRSVWTVREWAKRGFASNGMKLRTFRDRVTKIRYFQRGEVQRIADDLFSPAAA